MGQAAQVANLRNAAQDTKALRPTPKPRAPKRSRSDTVQTGLVKAEGRGKRRAEARSALEDSVAREALLRTLPQYQLPQS